MAVIRRATLYRTRYYGTGYTLHDPLEQAEILSEIKPLMAFVDRSYRDVEVARMQIWKVG